MIKKLRNLLLKNKAIRKAGRFVCRLDSYIWRKTWGSR